LKALSQAAIQNGQATISDLVAISQSESVQEISRKLQDSAEKIKQQQQEMQEKSRELYKEQNKSLEDFITGTEKFALTLDAINPMSIVRDGITELVTGTTLAEEFYNTLPGKQKKAIEGLEAEIATLAELIVQKQKAGKIINEKTLEMILVESNYENTLEQQRQKLNDLRAVRDKLLEGGEKWKEAQNAYSKQQKKVNKMTENAKVKTDQYATSYDALGGSVKDATTALKVYLTDNKEINEETIKKLILDGKLKELVDDLTVSKKEQIRVDTLVKGIMDDIKGKLTDETTAYEKLTEKLKAKQKADEAQLAMLQKVQKIANELKLKATLDINVEPAKKALKDIEKIDKDIAKAIIQSKLEIAETSLKMAEAAIINMEADSEVTEQMVENIRSLQAQIGMYTDFLDGKVQEGETKFLQSTLWGTGDDDDPTNDFTGQDFVDSVNIVFDAVGDALNSLSTIISNNLSEQTDSLETEKQEQVDAFLASAEAEVMTEEEKATKVEEIETGFNKKMFDLELEAFKKQQAFQYAQVGMATAMAIMNIWAQQSASEFFSTTAAKWIMTGLITAMGIAQAAAIASTPTPTMELGGISGETFADGGMVVGNSHKNGGVKFAVGGRVVELEGGEAVINKKSTAMFRNTLSGINQAGGGKKFAQGGITLDSDIMEQGALTQIVEQLSTTMQQAPEIVLTEADVSSSQKSVETIETKATF